MTTLPLVSLLADFPALRHTHTLLVAVSGGPDSLVLLHALTQTHHAAHLHVFHLDHGLRGAESAAEADLVRDTVTAWGIPVHCERADVRSEAPAHPNLSEAARVVRYRRLAAHAHRIGADAVLVAHTRDDQAETFIMRLLRGSGIRGLSAMASSTPWQQWAAPHHHAADGPPLLRPLLAIDRSVIDAYVAHAGLTPTSDPSNTKTTALRVRVRHQLLPLLRREQPQLNHILAATAEHLRQADDFIEHSLDHAWDSFAVTHPHAVHLDPVAYESIHPALQTAALRRVILHAAGTLRGSADEHIAALRSAVLNRSHVTTPLPLDITLTWHSGTAVVRRRNHAPAAFALLQPRALVPGDPLQLQAATLESTLVPAGMPSSPLAVSLIPSHPYTIRTRQPGDVIGIGHGKHRRVQDVLVDAKIPAHQRAAWPLLCHGDTVVWVVGVRLDPAYHCEGAPALLVTVET